jgi:hypothetical protein
MRQEKIPGPPPRPRLNSSACAEIHSNPIFPKTIKMSI